MKKKQRLGGVHPSGIRIDAETGRRYEDPVKEKFFQGNGPGSKYPEPPKPE